jgi:hypothetical protein
MKMINTIGEMTCDQRGLGTEWSSDEWKDFLSERTEKEVKKEEERKTKTLG